MWNFKLNKWIERAYYIAFIICTKTAHKSSIDLSTLDHMLYARKSLVGALCKLNNWIFVMHFTRKWCILYSFTISPHEVYFFLTLLLHLIVKTLCWFLNIISWLWVFKLSIIFTFLYIVYKPKWVSFVII